MYKQHVFTFQLDKCFSSLQISVENRCKMTYLNVSLSTLYIIKWNEKYIYLIMIYICFVYSYISFAITLQKRIYRHLTLTYYNSKLLFLLCIYSTFWNISSLTLNYHMYLSSIILEIYIF